MPSLNASQNLAAGIFIFAFLAISLIILRSIHAIYFSSLAHVPGPALNKVTELPLRYLNAQLKRNERIFEWHRKYGPVVAIAPGQVSFSSAHIAKEIYSTSAKHPKSSYFDNLAMFGYRSVFMAKEASEHRRLRKRIFAYYQPTKVFRPAVLDYVREYAKRACGELDNVIHTKKAGGVARVDMFVHCNNFSFDQHHPVLPRAKSLQRYDPWRRRGAQYLRGVGRVRTLGATWFELSNGSQPHQTFQETVSRQ